MSNLKASALVTRQEVIDYLELSSLTNAQATVLDRIIEAVTQRVSNYCGRKFKKKPASGLGSYNPTDTPYDSIYDGTGTRHLFLVNYPVATVATLLTTYYTEGGIKDVSTINSDDYRLYKQEGMIELTKAPDVWGKFVEAPQSIEVYYKAGYTATDMPEDLKLACKELAAIPWRARLREQSIISEELSGARFQYDTKQIMPDWVKDILNTYVRVNM